MAQQLLQLELHAHLFDSQGLTALQALHLVL